MKVVIDIPEVLYDRAKKPPILGMYEAIIAKGVPLDKIRAEIDDATEIHSDGEFYIKNIDVKRIIDRYTKDGE